MRHWLSCFMAEEWTAPFVRVMPIVTSTCYYGTAGGRGSRMDRLQRQRMDYRGVGAGRTVERTSGARGIEWTVLISAESCSTILCWSLSSRPQVGLR